MTTKTVTNANPPSTAPTMAPTFRDDDDDARFTWLVGVASVEFDEGEVVGEGSEVVWRLAEVAEGGGEVVWRLAEVAEGGSE